jgi:hypothetical protein
MAGFHACGDEPTAEGLIVVDDDGDDNVTFLDERSKRLVKLRHHGR